MTWQGRSLGRRRRACLLSGQALSLSCMLSLSLAVVSMLARPGIATASGSGTLTFTPPSGSPGTQVTVTIATEPPSPTPYLLSVSPTDPAANSCADGVQISDAPKIVVVPDQPTTTTFTWPAEFFSGAYYLCAAPGRGQKGPTVWSQQPFSVSSGTPIGPAPVSTGSGVVAQVPPSGVAAGGDFTLTVDTAALGGIAPASMMLLDPARFSMDLISWVDVTRDGTVYTYTMTLPSDTPPGTYEVQVYAKDGSLLAISNTFQVVSASARGGPQRQSSPPIVSVPGTSAISPFDALLVAVIALLLALAVASLAAPLLRRRHPAGRPPDAPTY